MKTAIASVSISGSLQKKLEAIAAAGFDAVEIFDSDLIQFPGTPSDVKEIADDLGLSILALQPFRDFEGMPEKIKKTKINHLKTRLEMMHELGTQRILFCSNVLPYADGDKSRCAADLNEAAEIVAREGFIMGYEALSWGKHIADYDDAWDLIERADHSALGINLDTFHMFSRGNTLDCLRNKIPVEKIALVQVADAPTIQMYDYLQYSRHYRCFPGQGELPIVEFMKVLRDKQFDDYISHEIFNDEFRASLPRERAKDGIRSMVWLDKQMHDVKPEFEVTDIEFIEFAIDGEEGEQLVAMLKALGFRESHQHVSKNVSLMQMGDINLVLNREPKSQAHQYYSAHGASVCALALATSSVSKALKQAADYRIQRFDNATGPSELNIPAIRGVGDSLLYLVERNKKFRFYDIDFEAVENPETTDAGLTRIDHIAQSVANTEFLSASFFYKSIFNFDISPLMDLPDIYGLVSSRVALSPNNKVRIPINMTESKQASPQRFINHTQGAGVQQIAFAAKDIFKAAKVIGKEKLLPIPENYYRDIAGKFDLPKDKIHQMRSLNILYDANEDGEFYHFYTQEVHGAFFEVVQRVGNYQNYGEANAPIRFGAQASLLEARANSRL